MRAAVAAKDIRSAIGDPYMPGFYVFDDLLRGMARTKATSRVWCLGQ